MKRIPPSLTTALAALTALSLGTGDLMAKKKDDKKSGHGKGKKEAAHHREAPRRTTHTVTRSSGNKGKSHAQPARRVVSRSSPSRSKAPAHRLATVSPRTTFQQREKSKAVHRTPSRPAQRVASTTKKSREHHQVTRSRAPERSAPRRSAVASRERDTRTHFASQNRSDTHRHTATRSSASRSRDRDHDNHRHDGRDRSRYVQRHGNHTHDWYRSNGYNYDRYHWQTHQQHRYYNDVQRVYIISPFGPSYGSDYTPTSRYYYGSGYDVETRMAVQAELSRAGYYFGAIDGQIGPRSQSAIYAYQQDNGLPTTGTIGNELIESLGIGY